MENKNPTHISNDGVQEPSGLEAKCYDAIGKKLFAGTFYGWGWFGNKEVPNPPPSFEFILHELWKYNGESRGGIGKIEDIGHPYHGWFLIFSTRHVGTWNFDTTIGAYNTEIVKSYTWKGGWPLPKDPNEGCAGFGAIGFKEAMKKSIEYSNLID